MEAISKAQIDEFENNQNGHMRKKKDKKKTKPLSFHTDVIEI
jgi:hypothetical protein